ncbi:hypothetical protein ACTXT7_009334 [Hymenolepis weldensis]
MTGHKKPTRLLLTPREPRILRRTPSSDSSEVLPRVQLSFLTSYSFFRSTFEGFIQLQPASSSHISPFLHHSLPPLVSRQCLQRKSLQDSAFFPSDSSDFNRSVIFVE